MFESYYECLAMARERGRDLVEIRKEGFRRNAERESGALPEKGPGRLLVMILSGILFRERP